jgi:hypothetical protein
MRRSGSRETPYLHVVAAGYDALDVLVLNAPDLSKIDAKQQAAIVDWLRGGGTLWMWPGATATPAEGPLIEALPALLGENQLIELDPENVKQVGLARVEKIRARQLTPIPGAEPVPLIGTKVVAFRRTLGLGQIVLAPIDLATLRFTSNLAVQRFWSSMLRGVPDRTRDNFQTRSSPAGSAKFTSRARVSCRRGCSSRSSSSARSTVCC